MPRTSSPFSGELVRLLRSIKGLKQNTVASEMHISQQAYSRMEKRKSICIKSFSKAIRVMNCSEDEVAGAQRFLGQAN